MVRTALVDAASVASLMTTTECIVVEEVVPQTGDDPRSQGGMPGMGGMGY